MYLTDRATNVLGDLLNEPGFANGAFVLIGHSLGGLLIKQILRTCQSEALNDEKAASFLRRVEKIAFLATPHAGADLAVWGDRLRILIRPSAATICLVRNDSNLRDLNLWYRGWSNHQNITHLVLTETKSLSILGMIVKPDSSDPGLAGKRPRPMDYDHGAICKPRSRTSDTYIAVRSFIELPFERPRDLVAERLEKIEVQQAERLEKLAVQQKELAAQVAREKRVEVAPLLAVLVKLGEKGVREEDILKQLDAKADELLKLRAENENLRRGQPALWMVVRIRAKMAQRKKLAWPLRSSQLLLAVERLVANDGWVTSRVKAVSRRRRGPQARLYRACHPAILDHRGRRLTPATLLPPPSMRGFTPPVTRASGDHRRGPIAH